MTAADPIVAITLLLPGDVAKLTPNRLPLNRMARWRMEQQWKEKAGRAWDEAGLGMFPGRVRLRFTVYRWRRLDQRNIESSLAIKYIEDSLIGKAFPNDTHRWVEHVPVEQVSSLQYRRCPAVSVTLEGLP